MEVEVLNMEGKKVSTVELPAAIFEAPINIDLMHQAFVQQMANARLGTHETKVKSDVAGGGRKPWRQKGTGRARAGHAGSPVWTHGGVAFAPKPRDYSYTLNKKVKRLAIKSALSSKAAEGEIVVIDTLAMPEIKTKAFRTFLDQIDVTGKALVITKEVDESVIKSARNIPGVETTFANVINPYDVLNAGKLVVDKAALETIEEVFA